MRTGVSQQESCHHQHSHYGRFLAVFFDVGFFFATFFLTVFVRPDVVAWVVKTLIFLREGSLNQFVEEFYAGGEPF